MSQPKNVNQEIVPTPAIQKLLEQGVSKYGISKCWVSPKRIYNIANGKISKKRGRQAKFNKAHIDYVIILAKSNPYITNKFIRESFFTKFGDSISSGLVSKWLNEGMIFYGKPIVIQALTDYQIIARYNFALETLQKPDSFFTHMTFSDESRFCTNSDSIRIYREKG